MKKFVSVFLTAAMAAASLTGCQSGGSSDALTPVTLNEVAHYIFYAPQYASCVSETGPIQLTSNRPQAAHKLRRPVRTSDPE